MKEDIIFITKVILIFVIVVGFAILMHTDYSIGEHFPNSFSRWANTTPSKCWECEDEEYRFQQERKNNTNGGFFSGIIFSKLFL